MPLRAGLSKIHIIRRWLASAAFVVEMGPSAAFAQQGPTWRPLEAFIRVEPGRITIGDELSRGPALFGRIVGVTLDHRGNIYVLDGSDHSVRAFDGSGRHLASAGQPGRGPGDLRYPIAVWHDGDRYLQVVDQYDGISRFEWSDGRLRYVDRYGSELRPTNVCGIGAELFVPGKPDGGIIHVLTAAGGRRIRSFGTSFRADSVARLQEVHDDAQLKVVCDEAAGRIYVAEGAQSLVRAYTPQGRMLWQRELPGYVGYRVGINRNPPGVATFWGNHLTRSMTRIGQDLLVVQAAHVERRRDPVRGGALASEDLSIVTWVLSASTGQVLTRHGGQGGPPFLADSRFGQTAGFLLDPVPQAFILRVERR